MLILRIWSKHRLSISMPFWHPRDVFVFSKPVTLSKLRALFPALKHSFYLGCNHCPLIVGFLNICLLGVDVDHSVVILPQLHIHRTSTLDWMGIYVWGQPPHQNTIFPHEHSFNLKALDTCWPSSFLVLAYLNPSLSPWMMMSLHSIYYFPFAGSALVCGCEQQPLSPESRMSLSAA